MTDPPPAAGTPDSQSSPGLPSTTLDPAFLSSFAHELRNPLAPLVNALYLLRTKVAAQGDAAWALDVVDRQVADLRSLLDDASDLARLMRGNPGPPTGPVSAAGIAQDGAEAARPVLAARRQAVVVGVPRAPVTMHGDRARLTRAVRALVVHVARHGAPEEAISLTVDDCEPAHVAFVVAGPGTAAADAIHPVPAQAALEAGIGVTLADAVARLHGGALVQRTDAEGRPRCELRLPRPV